MPQKRSVSGCNVSSLQSQYKADFLPHPELSKYDNEPPGYIHNVGKHLDELYIKRGVHEPVYQTSYDSNDRKQRRQIGTRKVYKWFQVE